MKFKKIRATFAAALLFLSSVALAGPTTAAADMQEEVYLVPFPRNGDEYYNDKWGHGSHTFMNGWGVGTSRYTTVRAMGSMYSNICYCIEPGVPQTTGDRYALSKRGRRQTGPRCCYAAFDLGNGRWRTRRKFRESRPRSI